MIIGLPKGSIKEKSIKLIAEFGFNIQKGKLSYTNDNIKFILLKHRDIPRLIIEEKIDYGITSEEWLYELQSYEKVKILKKLDWCDTRIDLISSKAISKINTCVTEYYNIAKSYFENKDVKVYRLSGSTEGCVGLLFDATIDCVESGSTLVANELETVETLFNSSVVLITGRDTSNPIFEKQLIKKLEGRI